MLGGIYQSVPGLYYDTLSNLNGCDSVVSVQLHIDTLITSSDSLAICSGDSILIGGVYQYSSGIYFDTLSTINGCDSIVETTLDVLPLSVYQDSIQICDGDSILLAGNYQSTSGLYLDTLTSINGCDSIIESYLLVNPTYYASDTIELCSGDSLFVGGTSKSNTLKSKISEKNFFLNLKKFGYSILFKNYSEKKKLIKVFQMRFRPERVSGILDLETFNISKTLK